jgi:DNA-binding response OmpR family regulator
MTHRILVVDDEADITALVAYHLAKAGFRVSTAANGPDALKAAREERPDIVILDLMLPGISGYDVLAEMRKRDETREVGVILLTARREEADRIRGLSLGADDYLTKPFDFDELLARIEALVRRSHKFAPDSNVLQVADLVLDRELLEVRRGGDTIKLTAKELAILELLMSAPGRVFSRTRILNQVWGYSEDPLTNVVDVYIARLRRKIDTPGREPLLETVRGHGYRLRAAL